MDCTFLRSALVYFCIAPLLSANAAEPIAIEPAYIHLRNGEPREWSDFADKADGAALERTFTAAKNDREQTLVVSQVDVRQTWRVSLNGKLLGELIKDENPIRLYLPVPPGTLKQGENTLKIESPAKTPVDDISVGLIDLFHLPRAELLAQATISIAVTEKPTGKPVPCRLTIVDPSGSLQTTSAASDDQHAVRPGVIYTSSGRATFGVPAGKHVVYAGRGFEYSSAVAEIEVQSGDKVERKLSIEREVATEGYVACDTHIHTLTHSGHGDCTIAERMITLAGEGIELPIATDHNVHIDYELLAKKLGVRQYFTPVMGNELTTSVGHFNIFPVEKDAKPADAKLTDWPAIYDAIFGTPGVKIAILNHARDLHSKTRPFGPKLFNSASGEQLLGWPIRFNAMEIVNSGATQSDPLELTRDWMTLLNRGYQITPIGSSDSHDVSRFIVGQGRTYIRCDDRDPGAIDVAAAIENLRAGRVLVSYGLLAELIVNDKYQSGELAAAVGDEIKAEARVSRPSWIKASKAQLYANGKLLREAGIARGTNSSTTWTLPRFKHDVHLALVAIGEPNLHADWQMAKPYQPTTPELARCSFACSGAIWIDGDGDGKRSSARDYAERLLAKHRDPAQLVAALADYDSATAIQAASLLHTQSAIAPPDLLELSKEAAPPVREGFATYVKAWQKTERARLE
jgi:hypothetical protein